MPEQTRADDITDLRILHMLDVEQLTGADVAERTGRSRNAILGLRHRVRQTEKEHPCRCRKKANRDGGMKPKWWAK